MEREKVKEIKKAIEYNSVSEFMNRLPYADEFNKLKMVSFDDIITLINELERENKRLKRSNKNILFVNEKVIEKNDRLKKYIEGNEQDAKAFVNGWHKDLKKELENFAEWLAKRSNNNVYLRLVKEYQDELI